MYSFYYFRKGCARTRDFFLFVAFAALTSGLHSLHAQSIPAEITVNARVNTSAVSGDADDPAIWIHPTNPGLSLVIGTDKVGDHVYIWDMNGQELQQISVVSYPNNGDVHYGMPVDGAPVDIYVVGAESPSRVVVFKIDPNTRALSDITTAGGILTPQVKDPYGVCLYRRVGDGAMFVFVNSNGGVDGVLNQYQLLDDGAGKVKGMFVRSFGGDVNGNHSEGMPRAISAFAWIKTTKPTIRFTSWNAMPALAPFPNLMTIIGARIWFCLIPPINSGSCTFIRIPSIRRHGLLMPCRKICTPHSRFTTLPDKRSPSWWMVISSAAAIKRPFMAPICQAEFTFRFCKQGRKGACSGYC